MFQYLLGECSLDIVDWCGVGVPVEDGHEGELLAHSHSKLPSHKLTLSRLSFRWPIVEKVVTFDYVRSTSSSWELL